MGNIQPFKRKQRPRPQKHRVRQRRITPFKLPRKWHKSPFAPLIGLLLIAGLLALRQADHIETQSPLTSQELISCYYPHVFDGDTIECDGRRIRLQGIDAPEMGGRCAKGRRCVDGDPIASKNHMIMLTSGTVTCRAIEEDHYGRVIALCDTPDGDDISCAMVDAGHAVRRYAPLHCP